MKNYVTGKSIIVTGAAGGFGKLISEKAAALGGNVTCADLNEAAAAAVAADITKNGGRAQAQRADVTKIEDMHALAEAAVSTYGHIDVMVNNAGIMPLAFIADHKQALVKWNECIDINFRGVMNGTVAVYDIMMAQGRGHIINVSSIFGNHPVIGGAVYGATKAAVNYFSESVRVEARGKIKVTIVKPTGVAATGLSGTIVNRAAGAGILGQNVGAIMEVMKQMEDGTAPKSWSDPESVEFAQLTPDFIADAVIHAVDQPWGVSIGDITVRAAGDHYVL